MKRLLYPFIAILSLTACKDTIQGQFIVQTHALRFKDVHQRNVVFSAGSYEADVMLKPLPNDGAEVTLTVDTIDGQRAFKIFVAPPFEVSPSQKLIFNKFQSYDVVYNQTEKVLKEEFVEEEDMPSAGVLADGALCRLITSKLTTKEVTIRVYFLAEKAGDVAKFSGKYTETKSDYVSSRPCF